MEVDCTLELRKALSEAVGQCGSCRRKEATARDEPSQTPVGPVPTEEETEQPVHKAATADMWRHALFLYA